MQQIITSDDIKKLGTILGVWAHPDDESFTCAGIMAAAVKNGQTVVCITATHGEAGIQDEDRWPADQMGEIRTHELNEALKILGVQHHYWLNYADGECLKAEESVAVAKIKEIIDQHQPDTIFTFGPDGLTGHTDHQTVSRWASKASEGKNIAIYHAVENKNAYEKYLKKADEQFNIYFNIDKPPVKDKNECDIAFCLDSALAHKKFAALAAMPSQTEGMLNSFPKGAIDEIFECECYVRAAD